MIAPMAGEHDERPWGSFTVLDDQPDYKVKRMVVRAGKRLSYQRHTRRAEHWFIVAGSGQVTLDGVTRKVAPGDAVDIALGVAHRIENPGAEDLVFVEVQNGSYFGEDDIVRLEDDFGRVPSSARERQEGPAAGRAHPG
jgi:mannose-6-phosphate isomerase-like protein (cupin superfamily)